MIPQDQLATAILRFCYQQSYKDFLEVLPGTKKQRIDINCDPLSIQHTIDQTTIDCDTLILAVEIWDHEEIEKSVDVIVNHPKIKDCIKVILTLGYDNTFLGPNTYRVSWNYCYNKEYILNADRNWHVKEHNLRPGILSLNGRDASHRILLGYHLHKANLLNSIAFSQGEITVPISDDLAAISNLNEYTNLLPIKVDQVGRWNDFGISNSVYSKTYANIVTETEIEIQPMSSNVSVQMVSEKSYKPFFAGQIPVLLAAKGHLAYLKHFGFDVFEDLLPTEFDYMSSTDKIHAIVSLVQKGNDFFEDYYFSNLHRIKHNFDLAQSRRPWTQTLFEIKSLF